MSKVTKQAFGRAEDTARGDARKTDKVLIITATDKPRRAGIEERSDEGPLVAEENEPSSIQGSFALLRMTLGSAICQYKSLERRATRVVVRDDDAATCPAGE